jgi:uncharacterized Zn-finger protein
MCGKLIFLDVQIPFEFIPTQMSRSCAITGSQVRTGEFLKPNSPCRQPRRKRSNKDGKSLGPTPPANGKQDSPASSSSNSNSLSLTPSIPYSFLPTPYGATACAPLPASMGRVGGGAMPPNYMTPPSSRYEQPPRVGGGNAYAPPPAHAGHMYQLKCAQCSETFADEQSRVHHAQHRHSLNAQHVCAPCGGRFRWA